MLSDKQILVAGGDLRSVALSKQLSCRNTVYTLGLEESTSAAGNGATTIKALQQLLKPLDYIILPIPATDDAGNITSPLSKEELSAQVLLTIASGKTHILGGKLNEALRRRMDAQKLTYTDYLLREELAIKNAVPTAEGAIEIAMRELPVTISGLNTLVVGYGRIGKVISNILRGLGAQVTVSARKFSDLAWIQTNGFSAVHTCELSPIAGNFPLVFNTVPAMVFDEELLLKLPREGLLIDLASKPGGVDFDAAKRHEVKAIWALSLPGKVAPLTAATIIFETIENIDSERRYSLE